MKRASAVARPIYQQAKNERAQRQIAARVADYFSCQHFMMPGLSTADCALFNQACCFCLMEAKERTGYLWSDFEKMGTYILSKDQKWDKMTAMCDWTSTAFGLAVMDKAGELRMSIWRKPWPQFRVAVGGRTDRGDSKDIEDVVHIPVSEFRYNLGRHKPAPELFDEIAKVL